MDRAASNRSTILITGETCTGKESLPSDLLESTLFGHIKGAFTSAIHTKKGYFEVADHGTVFFDEIGTIAPDMQAKLLRVIQDKEFTPLGATEPLGVDVRILAATNEDLKKRVDEGTFREDLYHRLNVINIALPALRERKEDIPALVSHFFTEYCRENEKFLDLTAVPYRHRPDRGRGQSARAAVHAQSEDQAARHQDSEEVGQSAAA